MRNRTLTTFAGYVQIVTMKEFIASIPVQNWPKGTESVICQRYHPHWPIPIKDELQHLTNPSYRRVLVNMAHNESYRDNDPPVMDALTAYVTPNIVSKKEDLKRMVYDILTQAQYQSSCAPTHLIRLSTRLWLAANPKDYKKHTSGVRQALFSKFPHKAIVWRVGK